jgi:integrase
VSRPTVPASPQKRYRSNRHSGIYYRERADGSRSYSVYFQGSFVPAGTTEREAVTKQAELRRQKARNERVVLNDRTTFAELAEQWLKGKTTKLRPRTIADYRASLDLLLIPRFGQWRISAIDAEVIATLIRDLEREGLHTVHPTRPIRPIHHAAISNYLKPLQGTLRLAVRRRLITENPFSQLLPDDRPTRPSEPSKPHEWSGNEIEALLAAAEQLAARPESRYNYTPLVRLTARLGLRLGEVLGLQWRDFDRQEGVLFVRRQWLKTAEYGPTKTKAGNRRIALPEDLRRELIDLQLASKYSQDEHPIFASTNGTPLAHRNTTQRGFEAARDLAGLPTSLTFHDLRHAAASRLIAAGIDPVTVASLLGHEDPHVTLKIYGHLFDRRRRDEAIRSALAQ